MEQKEQLYSEMKELRVEKSRVAEGLDEVKAAGREYMQQIDQLRKERDGGQQGVSRQGIEQINADRQRVKGDVIRARMEKDRRRDQYYRDLTAFEKQKVLLNQVEFMHRVRNDLLKRDEDRRRRKEFYQDKKRKEQENRRREGEERELR